MEKKRLLNIDELNKQIDFLDKYRYEDLIGLESFCALEGNQNKDDVYNQCLKDVKGTSVKCGDAFIGRDRYLWLEKKVKIPALAPGYVPVGLFDFGKTGVNNKFGFESLLYVDGLPYQGVDGNHQEVLFDEYAGKNVTLTFLLWSGLEGGGKKKKLKHTIHSAYIGLLNEKTDELYYLLKNLSDTLIIIEDKKIKEELIKIVNEALKILTSKDHKETVNQTLKYLKDSLKKIKTKENKTIYITGHSHIDVTWLWRIKHTREKIQRTFSTVLKLMREYPEFVFIQSQPQLYKFLNEDNPFLFKQIEERIKENRWEIEGGMWLEADCNLPSGESLVRQFIHGTKYIKETFNKKCEYLWLPDVFGYSWALPQIMKLCNINTFMTTKISWNETNQMPNDLFYWKGIDGTKILTYFMNTPNNNYRSVRYGKVSNYSGELAAMTVYGAWRRFKNKELSNDLLMCVGFGDGGGGPTRNMLKNAIAIKQIPGLPNIRFETPKELFKKLHKNVKGKNVPVWKNELYLELHRATYTTQALSKKYNRKLEYKLLKNEQLSSISSLNGKEYATKKLDACWEDLLQCQFHDNLPGSSIKEVYDDTNIIYRNIDQQLNELQKENIAYLNNQQKDYYSLYRSGDYKNDELLFVPCKKQGYFLKEDKPLASQRIKGGYLIEADIKPFVFEQIRFVKGLKEEKKEIKINLKQKMIVTPFYKIKWNKKGFLSSVYDLENSFEVLNKKGNILRAYVNRPKLHDAWDIDIEYLDKYDDCILDDIKVVEEGSLRSIVEFKYHFNSSTIIQDLIIYAHNRRIDFKTKVNWKEDHRLLRALFDLNIDSKKANYDIQFGHLPRSTKGNNSWDKAKFEVCGHKWMDYSDSKYGVSLMSDCKYGYSALDKTIGITLLNSPKYPNPYADMGKHEFIYSLLPHKGKLGLKTIDSAMALNEPGEVYEGMINESRRLIIKDNDGVKIDAIKKAVDNDGYIIHLHEALGKETNVHISSAFNIKAYAQANLLEEYKKIIKKDYIDIKMKPFEIKCFRVWFR